MLLKRQTLLIELEMLMLEQIDPLLLIRRMPRHLFIAALERLELLLQGRIARRELLLFALIVCRALRLALNSEGKRNRSNTERHRKIKTKNTT